MFGQIASIEKPAMNFRVQRFDSAVEHLGEAGVSGDFSHGDARFMQRSIGSPGRKKIDSVPDQSARQLHETCFVTDTEQRSTNLHPFHVLFLSLESLDQKSLYINCRRWMILNRPSVDFDVFQTDLRRMDVSGRSMTLE